MPHVPRMPPADRFYARVDRFDCECPSCGRVISPYFQTRAESGMLHSVDTATTRRLSRQFPKNISVRKLVFNPHSQLLRCPWCNATYVAGLLLFPIRLSNTVLASPVDATPTPEQRRELSRLGQGWYLKQAYRDGETAVNLAIQQPCSCQPSQPNPTCPVHGASPAA